MKSIVDYVVVGRWMYVLLPCQVEAFLLPKHTENVSVRDTNDRCRTSIAAPCFLFYLFAWLRFVSTEKCDMPPEIVRLFLALSMEAVVTGLNL